MNHNLTFDFTVDRENNSITIKREFAAEVPLVWDAFTKKEILDQWWAPKPWKAKTKSMDLRDGGHWLYAMVGPDGTEHWSVLNYGEVKQQQQFSGKDAFTDPEGKINPEMPQSEWGVTFTDESTSTLVEIRISYTDTEQLDATIEMGFKEGITMTIEQLDKLLPELKK
ncbi:MAG: SRPBCC domain-containing protein [Bacteroidota bacterium]